jgi:hypothetical protein
VGRLRRLFLYFEVGFEIGSSLEGMVVDELWVWDLLTWRRRRWIVGWMLIDVDAMVRISFNHY